jgi:putative spermidine/putrescine transport system ATP-binding protein
MIAPALRVVGLGAPFGSAPGLLGITFDVAAGERLVIAGSSGAGKTTLLRAIAGLGPISAGRIEIAGRDATGLPAERRDAVYLHQTPLLFPHLSVFENVAFPLRVRGLAPAEVAPRVRDALASVQLEGFADRPPRTLSGGQRHRVALARAVVARPALLLLDEPLAALDPELRQEVREALIALQRAYGPALVLVTHDLDEAGLLADRIGVLLEGRLAQTAPPAELFSRPASLAVARFLGLPNSVPGQLNGDGRFESVLGTLSSDPRIGVTGPAVAVFRPDALVPGVGPLAGRVVAVHHRARETIAVIAVGELRLEIRVDPICPPLPGSELCFALKPQAVTILPA